MSLVTSYKRDLMLPRSATPVGYALPDDATFEEWLSDGEKLNLIDKWKNFAIGDWLLAGANKFGEVCYQAIDENTWGSYHKLTKLVWVSRNVPIINRNMRLTWTHHHEVASLPHDEQRFWLEKAVQDELTKEELKTAIRQKQLPPPLPVDEDVPFSSAAPQIHTNGNSNGNGYHAPVDEYEQQADVWQESDHGYTWTDPGPATVEIAQQVGYRLAAANHAISDDPNYDGDEWYTPQEYIDAAIEVMGCIDLDPATCEAAQEFVGAASYYTKQDNGLEYPWIGNVWINPPYSMPLIQQFVDKLIAEYEEGNVSQAIIITNNSSDTRWFHNLLSRFPACFTRGRVQFWRPNHENFGTRQGQTLFYVGPKILKFESVFSKFGIVVTKL